MPTEMRVRVGAPLLALLMIATTACVGGQDSRDAAPQAKEVGCDEVIPAFNVAFRGLKYGRRARPASRNGGKPR